MPSSNPHALMLTRDQRIQIQTLREYDYKRYVDIARDVCCTLRQVQYAINHRITSQKHYYRRHLLLTEDEIDVFVDFVYVSRINRRILYLEIAII